MPRPATPVELSTEERSELEARVRRHGAGKLEVMRAKILLGAAGGESTEALAQRLDVRTGTVSKIRRRFVGERLGALNDAPRSGRPRRYDETVEQRVLATLDKEPPRGFARWNGPRLAAHLGDVDVHQVWRVLRTRGISLERRRSWCLSTDPQFEQKAADVVGLYLAPPVNAVVIAVDEKPHIQALERAQGWLRLPNGQSLTEFNHEYERHGTTTLFAALNIATGQVKAGHYARRRRLEFLDFMNQVIADHPNRDVHVILDNLPAHKPKRDRWLAAHPRAHLHFTPTHASWLNQIEVWFSILSRQALRGASFTSIAQVRAAIDAFIAVCNPVAHPFAWTKVSVRRKTLASKYADLRK
jgi:transposase